MSRRYRWMALLAIAAVALGTAGAFVKPNPFKSTYTLRAVFDSAAQLHDDSEVRVAGVRVGRVTDIAAGPGHRALVTMEIEDDDRSIRSDARLTVKPRLALEGNAYIDLVPGSPSARELSSGALIGARQTTITPQLDQLLNTFDGPLRDALHGAIDELADGLGSAPAPGARGLRAAVRELDAAFPSMERAARALQGERPGDLSRAIGGVEEVTSQLARDPRALADFVSNYNTTFAALARENRALAASIEGFDDVLRVAPEPLRQVDAALPTLTRFANRLRPVLAAAPAALRDTNGLLDQVNAATRPAEVPRLLQRLRPTLQTLPRFTRRLRTLFGYTEPVTDCIASHVVPTLNMKIEDGRHTTGDPIILDLAHAVTGLTGMSSAVDGNGGTVRLGTTFHDGLLRTTWPGLGELVGNFEGFSTLRPTWLGAGVNPPFRPDQPCARQPLPDLNTPAAVSGPPDWVKRGEPVELGEQAEQGEQAKAEDR